MMEKKGLVEGSWGTRLGKNVKLYRLLPSSVVVSFQQDGLELEFKKKNKPRRVERIDPRLADFPQEAEPLIGRDMELGILSSKDYRFTCIVGVAGMGKSSLARAFLQRTNEGQNAFWHAFKEIDTLTYLVGRISAFMSQRGMRSAAQHLSAAVPAGNEWESGQLEAVTDQLDKLKCVMVFDDFHKVKDEKITIFLKYLQQRSKNKIIVLTRTRPPFYIDDVQCKELVLQGLPLEDARKMIAHLGLDADEDAAAGIWRRFSGHPMSLKIYSLARARQHPSFGAGRPAGSDSINDYFKREIFEILSNDEQNILLTLSVFRTAVKSKAFKGININQRNLAHMIHSLEKKMIISRTASDKFLVHDMLRDILYPVLAYPEDAHASAARYYLSEPGAENAVEALYHFSKSQDTEGMVRILEEELIDEKYRLIEGGYAAPLVEILNQVDLHGLGRDQLGYFYNIRGKALSMLYRWDEGKRDLEKTIKLSEDASDMRLLAYSLRNYGDSLYLHGDFHGAEKRLLQAAKMFSRQNKADKALGLIYMRLTRLYFATGRFEESKKYSDLAKSISMV